MPFGRVKNDVDVVVDICQLANPLPSSMSTNIAQVLVYLKEGQ
jgi:hypothetical protein